MKTIEGLKLFQKKSGLMANLEEAISHETLNKIANQALPKMVWLIREIVPELREERIAETQKVLLAASMNGLETSLSLELMELSVGSSYKLHNVLQYYCLNHNIDSKNGRMELWGTEWELPVRLAAGIIRDTRDGINLESPCKSDLEKSQTFAVARVFTAQRAGDANVFDARDRQNKEIDEFISNYK